MTVTEARRRPSPYPRPTTEAPPTSTESETEPCTAASEEVPAERETRPTRLASLQSAITDRDTWGRLLVASRAYVTPPSIFTDPAPSLPELSQYAHRGAWTAHTTGTRRALGVVWWRLIAYPKTALNRLDEFIWQRPGRLLAVALLTKLIAHTTPGTWVVDNIIVPVAHGALWLFL